MKKLCSIGLFVFLVLIVSLSAVSQVKSSATQTVAFAVHRSLNYVQNVIANSNTLSSPSGIQALQNEVKQQSVKVTISAPGKSSDNNAKDAIQAPPDASTKSIAAVHVDLRSDINMKKIYQPSMAVLITVTE